MVGGKDRGGNGEGMEGKESRSRVKIRGAERGGKGM